jgi:hypothetical protein
MRPDPIHTPDVRINWELLHIYRNYNNPQSCFLVDSAHRPNHIKIGAAACASTLGIFFFFKKKIVVGSLASHLRVLIFYPTR